LSHCKRQLYHAAAYSSELYMIQEHVAE